MQCPTCGSANPAGKNFCGDCGAPLPLACAACGAENPPGKKFCGDCGAALEGAPAASAGGGARATEPARSLKEPAAHAERRQLTVMYCDLVGSTALSTRLDPEDLRELFAAYRRCVADTVGRYDGFVAKHMGDGVLVYFGYPQAHEDDAERAVRAGLELVAAVGRLETRERLQVRIGIATGLVVVGDLVGAGEAQERGVVGETPNLAARLQAVAEPDAVVIAASTRRLLGALFDYRDLGGIEAKGFAKPVQAWRVLRPSAVASRFEAFHAPAELTALIGREEEVDLLLRRWRQAKGGEGRVVLFTGEAGIGKSRITRAVQERLAGEPHARLLYFCSPHHQASALFPVISQLERAAGFDRDDAVERKLDKLEALIAPSSADVAREAATFGALLSIPTGQRYPQADPNPQRRKEETLAALMAQLGGLATRRPVLMIFEDAHWIDPTSMEFVERAIDRVQTLPVLLIVTARPEFAPPWAGRPHVTIHPLNRLSRRDGLAMIERVTGGRALPREVEDQIVKRTDGVPLFIEELTKMVLGSGLLAEAGGRYELSGPLPPLAIPATLHDSLMARLDRLGPIKEVAQIGAVIGRDFSYEVLAALAPLDEKRLRDALDGLAGAELIFRRGVPPDATYSFKHALVQDAAYQSLLKSNRQQIHQRIARILESRFQRVVETQPEILAQHFAEGGLSEDAIRYWHRAGQLAAQRSANAEAVTHCERALRLLSQMPETPARDERELELQMIAGPALVAARGFADQGVGRAYARASELCQRLGDTARLPIVLRGRQVFHRIRGELADARGFAEQLAALAERQQDPALLVGSCHALGQDQFQLGQLTAARKTVERGIALFDPERHRLRNWPGGQPGEQCYLYGAFVLWMLGYPDDGLRRAEEALALAKKLANPANLINTLAFVALVHVFRREAAAARARATATSDLCAEHRNPYFLAWATILHGWAECAENRAPSGLAELERGIAAYRETRSQTWLPCFLGLQAESYRRAGRLDDGLVCVAEALAIGEKTGERCGEAELYRIKGELCLAASPGGHAEAEACLARSLAIARDQQAKSWELRASASLARLWRGRGKCVEARDLLAPVCAWFAQGRDTPDLAEADSLLADLREASAARVVGSAV